MVRFSWIIPALPLASFFAILLFGKRMRRGGAEVGIAAVFVAFILSLIVAAHFIGDGSRYAAGVTWFNLGTFKIGLTENIDGLTSVSASRGTSRRSPSSPARCSTW